LLAEQELLAEAAGHAGFPGLEHLEVVAHPAMSPVRAAAARRDLVFMIFKEERSG
jgi:hypothetical protein